MYLSTLTAAGVVIIGGGPITAALAAAGLSGGAATLIGVLLAKLIGKHHADYLENQIKKGGLLLWVHLKDKTQENLISRILNKNSAQQVHSHCMPAASFLY